MREKIKKNRKTRAVRCVYTRDRCIFHGFLLLLAATVFNPKQSRAPIVVINDVLERVLLKNVKKNKKTVHRAHRPASGDLKTRGRGGRSPSHL